MTEGDFFTQHAVLSGSAKAAMGRSPVGAELLLEALSVNV
jgi:hypothetical protein